MAEVHTDQPSLARDTSNATAESLAQSVLKSVSDSNPKVPASSEQEGAQRSISQDMTFMMKSMTGTKEADANMKGVASEKPATKAPSFGRLLQLSRPEWGALSRALFVALGAVGLDLLVPKVMGIIMDILIYPHFMIKEASIFDIVHFDISTDKRAEIRRFTFICLALRTASAALSIVKGVTFGIVGARVVARMKVKLFGAMLVQDISFFEAQSSGDLASRLGADAASVQMVATTGCPDLVIALIKIVIAFVFVFRLSWQLSLMVLGLLPLVTIYCLPFVFVFQRYNTRYQDTLAVASSVATQAIGNARTVRSFVAEDFTSTLYGTAIGDPDAPQACCWWPKRNQSTYRIGVVRGIISQTMIIGTVSIATLGQLMITWYAYLMVVDSDLTYGTLNAFLQYAVLIGMNVAILIKTFLNVVQAKGASQRVFEIIDRQPAIPIKGGERPSELIGEIRFEDVTFAYPLRLESQILQGLSFRVPSKSTAAFVGASGSGKSTVLLLLQRLYDVTGGKVLLDGRDICSLDVGWLRRHIGVVQQEPVLFGFSLRENICFGRTAAALCGDASFASEKEMVQASTEANAATFINSFPDGYDTLVGERGVRLSGGQKQRIAIARALICNPAVLLLDEATSALDSESEHLVQEAIDRVMKDRTVLIVAHRLSTVINSDQIMVMSNAGLVDSGTHQELLKRCERYKQLVQRQILGEGTLEAVHAEEAVNLTELTKSDSKLKRIVSKPEMEKLDAARLEALVMMNSVDEKSRQDKKDAVADGPKPSVWSMFKPAKKEMPVLLVILIVSMGSTYAELEIPMLQGDIVNVVLNFMQTGEWRKEEVKRLFTIMILIQAVTLLWGYARGVLQLIAGERIVSRLRLWCFKSIFKQEVAFFDTQTSGQLQARLGQDAQIVQAVVTSSMLEFVLGILRAALAIARMLVVSWEITLMVFAIIPATGCILVLPLLIMKNLMVKLQDAGARASNIAVEATGNMRTVISFGSEEFIGAIFNVAIGDIDGPGVSCWWPKKSQSTYRYSCQVALVMRTSTVLAQWFGMCVLLVIGWYTYDLVIDGKLTIGDIQVIILYGMQIMIGTAGAGGPIALIGVAMGGAQRIFQIINREPAFPNSGGSRPAALQGEVSFEDVSFSYPARPNQLILESLSFKVPTNSTAAFVGSSGCGKSTTLVLLQRFYEPTFGRVLIDGQDLRTLDAGWVRRRMSFVQQEPVLFGFSIRDNIAYGCHAARSIEGGPPATEDDIRKASEQANAHKFISDLPNGYDTLAGDRGALLSGGQKQRIAIARALLTNPRILLLDEATSALDAESEHLVQEAIDRMMANRTVLMIAHRLSTVQNAHQIMVMDKRKLIDTGRHEELLQRCEKYQELVKHQVGQSVPAAVCCEI